MTVEGISGRENITSTGINAQPVALICCALNPCIRERERLLPRVSCLFCDTRPHVFVKDRSAHSAVSWPFILSSVDIFQRDRKGLQPHHPLSFGLFIPSIACANQVLTSKEGDF